MVDNVRYCDGMLIDIITSSYINLYKNYYVLNPDACPYASCYGDYGHLYV